MPRTGEEPRDARPPPASRRGVELLNGVAAASPRGLELGLVAAALGFGFRHGIDWDHLAALLASARLPPSIDAAMERIVGATLLALGGYVVVSLVRTGRDFRMQSRWMMVLTGAGRVARWLRRQVAGTPELVVIGHEHAHPGCCRPDPQLAATPLLVGTGAGARALPSASGLGAHARRHRHVVAMPEDPFHDCGRLTAFGVGMLHGVGAETPTQVLVFVAAAGAGGRSAGVLLLTCFVVGLLCANSLVALASTAGFLRAARSFRLYAAVSLVTAAFSLAIGALFVLGHASTLPALLGG